MAVDVLVIGAGPGGYAAALRAAQHGARVSLVEQDAIGGTCLHRGCIPSKVMRTTAELRERFLQAGEFGLELATPPQLRMPDLMARKDKIIANQVQGLEKLLARNKIRLVHGRGRITGRGHAEVLAADGTRHDLSWDRLILAPGSRPYALPSLPFDGRRILSSDHVLSLSELPERVLVVGGGVVGCEMAFILAALGCRVSVVEARPRLLPLSGVDPDCGRVLEREMKNRKMGLFLEHTLGEVTEKQDRLEVTLQPAGLQADPGGRVPGPSLKVDRILVCIGRAPNSDDLGLERVGLQLDAGGWLPVDDRLQTAAEGVYAVGDILGPSKVMLAHVAWAEADVAAANALGNTCSMDYAVVPGAIFTMPEVACVGLTEEEAREQQIAVRADVVHVRTLAKPQVLGEIAGMAKLVTEAGTGRLLGVHLVGMGATDLISEATLAVKLGCTAQQLAQTIHPHPTMSEMIHEAACKAVNRPFHG